MTVKHQVALLGCMCVAASAPTALRAQGIGFIPAAAACGLKASSRVNSGMESLRTGTNTKFADQRTKAFKEAERDLTQAAGADDQDRKSTRLNSSHGYISYAVFCLKKKKKKKTN